MFFLKIHPACPSDANVINPGSNQTLTDKLAAEHSIASIIGSHPTDNPPHTHFLFNFKINSILGSHPPDPTPVRPPLPRLFFCFTITSIHGSHPPDPHRTTPYFFQFSNSFSFRFTTTRTPDRPPPLPKKDFHKGHLFRRAPRFEHNDLKCAMSAFSNDKKVTKRSGNFLNCLCIWHGKYDCSVFC